MGQEDDFGGASSAIDAFVERGRSEVDAAASERLDCDVSDLPGCDGAAVDAMARLCLRARRRGVDLRLLDPCPELVELIRMTGLDDLLLD